jgi:hypothetical protein
MIRFISDLLERSENMMSEKLLFRNDKKLPVIDLYSIIDNPNNHEAGFYFPLVERNALANIQAKMLKALMKSEVAEEMVEILPDDLQFQQAGIDQYMAYDIQFRELLYILMTITCGLSGRVSEMTSLKYINTIDGDRNILIEDGQVMFITEYHKSMALMDSLKVLKTSISES